MSSERERERTAYHGSVNYILFKLKHFSNLLLRKVW